MKKIYNLIAIIACLGLLWSCDNDRDSNPTLNIPDSFVLNTPQYVTGVYDLKNTETVQLTCSQPDYGFTAAAVYSVEISLTSDFAESTVLASKFTTAKMDVSAIEMAVALVGLQGIESEEDYPTDPFPVFVRLKATLPDGSAEVLSNYIELPKVKGYFALEPLEIPTTMYIVGNITNNWSWTNATSMVPVNGEAGKFFAIQYLGQVDGANAQIKFNMTPQWDDYAVGYSNVTIDATSTALAGVVDNGGNIEITNPGWYIVVVTATINGLQYEYTVEFLPPNVYLQGAINGGDWGANNPLHLFTVPDLSLGSDAEFVSPAFAATVIGDPGVRACISLSGFDWWKTEFIVIDGVLEYRGNGGDQDRVSGIAGQKLYINFTKKTGKIE